MSQQITYTLGAITYHRNDVKTKIKKTREELHRLYALDDTLSQCGAMIIELGRDETPDSVNAEEMRPMEHELSPEKLTKILQDCVERHVKTGMVVTEKALHDALNRVRTSARSEESPQNVKVSAPARKEGL